MDLQTVSDISKKYNISTRMLRYYEQNGLISSRRMEGYSYRVYGESAVKRLQQVIILRKLQIPVKQIRTIVNNPDTETVIEIFKKNIQELDSEATALSTIRRILDSFVNELESVANVNLNLNFLNGNSVLEMASSLPLIQKNIKERTTMSELNQAAEILNKPKVRVELAFNGNCAEAIALYEKAFGVKVDGILRYKDVPSEDGSEYPEGTENFVMHTWLKIGNDAIGEIGMHDRLPDKSCSYGDGVSVSVGLGSADAVKVAYDILKEDGKVIDALEAVFFSEAYCEVRDKFGVNWIMMYN